MLQSALKNKLVVSIGINLLLFLAVNLFLLPILNSGDDVFLLYTLSGGYGDAPTSLLHYNHIWHPALGWIVKSLFESFPSINWYAVFLMGLQLVCSTVFLLFLLKKFRFQTAFILYFIFFWFIEIRIIHWLNFSSTAWITAVAGFILLMDAAWNKSKHASLIFPAILLLLAGLLRLHILAAVTILLLPAFIYYTRRSYKKWLAVLASVAVVLILLNLQHVNFYKKNIPGWQKQEEYRQAIFKLANRSEIAATISKVTYQDSIAFAFYKSRFYIDTSILSIAKFGEMEKRLKKQINFNKDEFFSGLYWLFTELRVYLLLLLICLSILWQSGVLKHFLRQWLLSVIIVAGAYFFLLLFMKMTFTLHMGVMLMLWVYSVWILKDMRSKNEQAVPVKNLLLAVLILPFIWMGIRYYKTDKNNREQNKRFKCMVTELLNNRDKLFVATNDFLPLNFYYIWDVPANNKIENLIYKDREITFSYNSTLQRFGVNDLPIGILNNPKVVLTGGELPELKNYYRTKFNAEIKTMPVAKSFNCLNVFYLQCISGCDKYSK